MVTISTSLLGTELRCCNQLIQKDLFCGAAHKDTINNCVEMNCDLRMQPEPTLQNLFHIHPSKTQCFLERSHAPWLSSPFTPTWMGWPKDDNYRTTWTTHPEGSLVGDTHMHLQKYFSFEGNSPSSRLIIQKMQSQTLPHKPTDVLLTFICNENTTFTTLSLQLYFLTLSF